jgi:hypothetical protein
MRAPDFRRTQTAVVIPAKAGIHFDLGRESKMDSGFRRNDEMNANDEVNALRAKKLTKHETNG